MELKNIENYQQLQKEIADKDKYFLFFYKQGSPASDCAYENLTKPGGDFPVFAVNVVHTKDIHRHYGVDSVPTLIAIADGKTANIVKGCQSPAFYEKILRGEGAGIGTGDGQTPKRVTVYSTPSCPYCNKLKQYLNKHGIRYTDINVAANPQAALEMERRSGQRGVPQTDINGQIIIGFDVPKLSKLLNIPTE